jgi:hypothetical protein
MEGVEQIWIHRWNPERPPQLSRVRKDKLGIVFADDPHLLEWDSNGKSPRGWPREWA